ncbi:Uncharacterized protein TPAR_04058, partial [Tolypocladium paradoxum]
MAAADDAVWAGVEDGFEDPEEVRVIFSALDSFSQYAKVAHFNVTHLRRRSFYALPQTHWKLLAEPPFNFLDTLEKTDDAIDSNADLARAIVKVGLRSFSSIGPGPTGPEPTMPQEWVGVAKHSDIDKARSTIRQFYRDWTTEGAGERAACYGPIMKVLEGERARIPESGPLKVLVPGAGLGRLVFELCRNGFVAEGNEISYHQLLASSYILNECERAGKHTIYPWVHTFSNHLTRQNHLRGYKVPDIHPATTLADSPGIGGMSMCAADFLCLYADDDHKEAYDAVASVFFLDTAPNLIRYLEVIHHCLRPGGVLINVGPLLWHFENQAPGNHGHDDDGDGEHDFNNSSGIADPGSFELSNDEVMALLGRLGFAVEWAESGVEAPYIQDRESMLQTVYKSSAWVARKPMSLGLATLRHLAARPHGTAVNGNGLAVNVRAGPAGQVHHGAGNVLRVAQAAHGVGPGHLVGAARHGQQAVGHLAREEARADGVDGDAPRAQLDGQVAAEVDDGRLAGRVAVRALLADGADAQPRDARRDDDPARLAIAAVGSRLLQQRRELAHGVEDGLDVEVHDLGEGLVRVPVERLAPGGARVGEENVHPVRVLLHLGEQLQHALLVGRVGGHWHRARTGGEVRERVERLAGGVAGGGFARRDEDGRGAGLQEAARTQRSRQLPTTTGGGPQAARAAGDDGDLALEGEERREVVELRFGHD